MGLARRVTPEKPEGNKEMMKIRVECHCGYRGEEAPRCFWMGEEKIEITDLIDRWLSPDYRYFKVMDSGGSVYILRHDAISQDWRLTFYRHRGTPQGFFFSGKNEPTN